ncbi:hypothetical protein [Streptomyces paromomycinus]|uniref:Uncharacterized protein n=1 Tax=Streptomyces paromomycinus TaxID=92743 RepID=A0A401W2J1_STREY|nr:hypothetical protein [Streptomyces paromomycinus]GCD43563.1 hypothetical protein GKJPGBOP_03244 [Streptomyces paromomycinus]
MSAASALPAAARLPRSAVVRHAVVRRALLAGLFLAGFVALGFAFGGGAQAADGSASTKPQVGALTPADPQASVKASAAAAGRELRRGGQAAVGAAAETPVGKAVRPVAERTAPAAGQVAEPVTGPVTERVAAPVRDVVHEVRQVAAAGPFPVELPGRIPGVGVGVDGDGDGDDGRGHGRGEQPGQGPGPQHAGAGVQRGAEGDNAAGIAGRWALTGELRGVSSQPVQHVDAASERWLGQGHGSLPGFPGLPGQLPQAPSSSSSLTAGDGHGPRGGDQFAAVPAHPAHFGLVPGGVLAAAEPPTRQRAADILEFPG